MVTLEKLTGSIGPGWDCATTNPLMTTASGMTTDFFMSGGFIAASSYLSNITSFSNPGNGDRVIGNQ